MKIAILRLFMLFSRIFAPRFPVFYAVFPFFRLRNSLELFSRFYVTGKWLFYCFANYYATDISLQACFISPDLARDLSNDIMSLLTSTKPYLRKKAVLILYKVFLRYKEAPATHASTVHFL